MSKLLSSGVLVVGGFFGFVSVFFSKSSSGSVDFILLLIEECKRTHKCGHFPLILQVKCHCVVVDSLCIQILLCVAAQYLNSW